MRITYEPAECVRGCMVPDCPYTHEESWFVGDVSFQTRREAEEYQGDLDRPKTDPITGMRPGRLTEPIR